MTSRRLFFGTIAGLAALATAGGTSSVAHAETVASVPVAGAPIEMQSEQNPRGRVLRPRSRGAYRRDWRTRRQRRRYWRRRAYRRGW